ncbi:hypothetical protein HNI00_14160 [Thermoleptolyngbya oregonensis NK1-22]|uniref:Uncharacterized protein n=1 Tax=Thermoleptolyngbya oregonensis NK1-22 TaxID=2547457 RepID=A0AA96YPS2_9CYAN|nr:hypothetical protein [Thermoleptolyngbya oregonensis]WOB44167.1 hypothetical protein HNI00_14160 [Thermoleptolyngbya oregonensis NK1-22]
MSENQPTIDERLDRVAVLLETSTQQIAYLSELIVTNGQQAAQRDASLNAKLDRLSEEAAQRDASLNAKLDRLTEAIATFVDQTQQRTVAIDDRLDRIAITLESQNRALEGHIRLAEQQAQSVATLTTLVSQLLAARV